MARTRFHRLDENQQQAILDAALTEFAAHGYADASLNRIIEASGISKGSMYYYFDGKEDLYAHVIRDQIERLLERSGPVAVPATRDPDEYWAELTDGYLRLMTSLLAAPDAAALLRGWLAGSGSPSLRGAQQEAEQEVLPWLLRVLAAGQEIGAVRTDLPTGVLVASVMALAQVVDTWLIISSPGDGDLEGSVRALMEMMRRAVGP